MVGVGMRDDCPVHRSPRIDVEPSRLAEQAFFVDHQQGPPLLAHTHRAEIRNCYGYRDFGEPPWPFRLTRWLFLRAWLGNERPSLLFDLATAWLIEHKILLPGVTTLTRLVARIRAERFAVQNREMVVVEVAVVGDFPVGSFHTLR